MSRHSLALKTFRLRNFKAICDSRVVRFTPLTVLIGNNGSGKSSLVEGLETFQTIVEQGLDKAMQQWRGFEHIWNSACQHELRHRGDGEPYYTNPMSFEVSGASEARQFRADMSINAVDGKNRILIEDEFLRVNDVELKRDITGNVRVLPLKAGPPYRMAPGFSSFRSSAIPGMLGDWGFTDDWQFVSLVPQAMGSPAPQSRVATQVRLAKDGSNIAEYLLGIRDQDPGAFDGIIDSLRYVLPYAADMQPAITSELERTVYLQMTEGQFKVPGWLLSTGTLRIVAMLALLRHPQSPRLIVIEEIENGLDPRTLNLLVGELRAAAEAGIQIIATTHSPHLLDAVPLESVVLCDRVDGEPRFTRPADDKEVRDWAKEFTTGRLYTMSRLNPERAR
jgi:predicted ATPase